MAAPDFPLPLYQSARLTASQVVAAAMKTADSSEDVAATIVRVAAIAHPAVRYASGKGAGRLALLRRYVPASAFDKSLRKQMRLR